MKHPLFKSHRLVVWSYSERRVLVASSHDDQIWNGRNSTFGFIGTTEDSMTLIMKDRHVCLNDWNTRIVIIVLTAQLPVIRTELWLINIKDTSCKLGKRVWLSKRMRVVSTYPSYYYAISPEGIGPSWRSNTLRKGFLRCCNHLFFYYFLYCVCVCVHNIAISLGGKNWKKSISCCRFVYLYVHVYTLSYRNKTDQKKKKPVFLWFCLPVCIYCGFVWFCEYIVVLLLVWMHSGFVRLRPLNVMSFRDQRAKKKKLFLFTLC